MNFATLLPDPRFLQLDKIVSENDSLTVHVHSTQQNQICPDCGLASGKRHSFYTRRLTDLPLCEVRVRLFLRLSKFFCLNDDCKRRIFVEQLPDVAARYARRTVRAAELLQNLAFYLGGRAGAKLAHRLKLSVGKDTLLRQLRRSDLPPTQTPRVLGVDDFAFRRGYNYGTILIDLERRQPVDLLPDRNAEMLQKWLVEHPGIEVVSRDRSPVYADAISTGAPAALQVADRFHLLKNIFESFERVLHRSRDAIAQSAEAVRQADQSSSITVASSVAAQVNEESFPSQSNNSQRFGRKKAKWHEQKQMENRKKRIERYETARRLRAEGCSISEISRRLRMHRETVRNFLAADSYPERAPAFRRKSRVARFDAYLRRRWREGCGCARRLFEEIKQQGYKGCYASLTRYLSAWRGELPPEKQRQQVLSVFQTPTPRQVKWSLLCEEKQHLSADEQKFNETLLASEAEIAEAKCLVKEFQRLLKQGSESEYEAWQERVAQSDGLKELKNFAVGLKKDEQAVRAAITTQWSNGQTEGQVNRLKFIKRSMYGRANFDLLKARVLFAN